MTVTVLVGNPKPDSRTLAAARRTAELLTGRPADAVIDLATFGPGLLSPRGESGNSTANPVDDAVATVAASRLVVVASPTYKSSYTGLLKLFLDRFATGELAGVTAVPLMLGAHWGHALAPEVFLKPVLAELGASTPTRALFLLDSQWSEADAFDGWLPDARATVAAGLAREATGAVA